MKYSGKNHLLFLLYFTFLTLKTGYGQSPGLFINYNSTDKLACDRIRCIRQDAQGFIWMGANNGLNKFDGLTNEIFSHSPTVDGTISDNTINAIYIDCRSNLWVGTRKGLNLYNYATKKFISFYNDPLNPHSLSDNEVWTIAEDHAGTLWIGTLNGGLNKMTISKRHDTLDYSFVSFKNSSAESGSISSNAVRSIFFDDFGNGWVGTHNGLNRFRENDAADNDIHFDIFKNNPANSFSISNNFITNIVSDEDSNLWLIGGMYLLDKIERKYLDAMVPVQFAHFYDHVNALANLNKTSILTSYADRQNRLWIGTASEGLFAAELSEGAITSIQQYKSAKFDAGSLQDDFISSLFEDRDDNLWIGTSSGVSCLPVYSNQFLAKNYDETLFPRINDLTSLAVDVDGNTWFSNENGLNIIKQKKIIPVTFYRNISDELSNCKILFHPNHSLWIATVVNGVFYCSKDQLSEFIAGETSPLLPRQFTDGKGQASSLSFHNVNHLGICRNGDVLVSTMGGLDIIDGVNFSIHNLVHHKNYPDSKTQFIIRTALEDSKGTIWAGSDNGLFAFRDINKPPVIYRFENGDSTGLPTDRILELFEDSEGLLWIGTQAGVSIYNSAKDNFLTLTTKDGLSSNNTRCIAEDKTGQIWIGTDLGLCRYDKKSKKISTFLVEDGLFSNEIKQQGLIVAPDGMMYVISNKGVNTFYPDQLYYNKTAPQTFLNDLKIYGESIEEPKYSSIKQMFWGDRVVTLRYDQNFFSVDFSTVSFIHPERDQFAYKLEGLDKDWNYIGTRRTAYFTNVPYGEKYTFRVKAANCDGVWNEAGISLPIMITRPWWATWWFRSLFLMAIICTIISITWFFAQQRLKKRLAVLEKQRAVEHERQRISRDMHDELGSGISMISMMSDLIKRESLSPKVKTEVEKISTASNDLVLQMREIVWTLNPQNDHLKNLLVYLRQYAVGFFNNTLIECKVKLPDHIPDHAVSGEMRRALFLVLKESLNNLLKHSQATCANIEILVNDHQLKIAIADNGVGLEESKMNEFGNGLKNMQRRMEEIKGSFQIFSEKGTKVVLLVSLDINP